MKTHGPISPEGYCEYVRTKNQLLSHNTPNDMVWISDKVYKIAFIKYNFNDPVLYLKKIENLKPLFEVPILSSILNIFTSDELFISNDIYSIGANNIDGKMFYLHSNKDDTYYFAPLVHLFENGANAGTGSATT